jgi:membrane fusion protein (multidrug efflux system)
MLRNTLIALAVATSLVACGKPPGAADGAGKGDDKKVAKLLIAPEDVLTVHSNALAAGPVITGSVQPERRADLRAEVSAIVLQVLKENGEPVKKGDLLVRLDDTSIRDSLGSSEESVRNAKQVVDQAQRMLERNKTLRASGMTSMQALEDAEVRLNTAQSELAAVKARAVGARQQLDRTLVRAPFDGIVSERKVSNGDTAQIGKELIKVIDPHSMRFEGLVSADKIGVVKVGQPVLFRVNGYPGQNFHGNVGLAISGSGDTLAGIIAGLAARGASLEQAAAWGIALHASAGEQLSIRYGVLGYLAREISAEIPALLRTLAPA